MVIYYCRIVLLLSIIFSADSFGTELETKVKYHTKSSVYIGAGSDQGIKVGDQAKVIRSDNIIAKIEVMFVSSTSASCRIIESSDILIIGDVVLFDLDSAFFFPEPETVEPQIQSKTKSQSPKPKAYAPIPKAQSRNNFRARLGMQVHSQNDLSKNDYDYYQPSIRFKGSVDNILGTHHNLSIRLKGRQNIRSVESCKGWDSDWSNRIYTLSIYYDPPQSRFRYSFGRILSNQIGSVGIIDGAKFDYRLSENVGIGAFGGFSPDRLNTEIDPKVQKVGVYTTIKPSKEYLIDLETTVAIAGVYHDGRINREFIYTRNRLRAGRKLTFSQSAHIAVNRGWRKNADNDNLQLSYFQGSMNWRPTKLVAFNFGYDNHRSVRTGDNRSIADSLFDESSRTGMRGALRLRVSRQLRLNIGSSFRMNGIDDSQSQGFNGGIQYMNILKSGVNCNLRATSFNNSHSNGQRLSFGFSRQFNQGVFVRAETGLRSYKYERYAGGNDDSWVKFSSSWSPTEMMYLRGFFESFFGESIRSESFMIEMSLRI